MTPNRHQGRIVLVTGAASGIGASIARQYAQEGASLALVDVNAKALEAHAQSLQLLGANVAWATADVSDFMQCESALAKLTSALGGEVDTLINNAGISPKVNGKPANFWEMDPAEWMKVVGVNLHGPFNWYPAGQSIHGPTPLWQHRQYVVRGGQSFLSHLRLHTMGRPRPH